MAELVPALDYLVCLKLEENEMYYLGETQELHQVSKNDIVEIANKVGHKVEDILKNYEMGSISFDMRSTPNIFLYSPKHITKLRSRIDSEYNNYLENYYEVITLKQAADSEKLKTRLERKKYYFGIMVFIVTISVNLLMNYFNNNDKDKGLNLVERSEVRAIVGKYIDSD